MGRWQLIVHPVTGPNVVISELWVVQHEGLRGRGCCRLWQRVASLALEGSVLAGWSKRDACSTFSRGRGR